MKTTKAERDQILEILDRPFHMDNENPATVAALHAVFDDLDEALAAIECVCDAGLLEDGEDAEWHIEGLPGYEFDAKWGDMSVAQIVERLRAVLPPSKKEKLPDDACPDCRNGVHCQGCTSGCPCRSTCGKAEWDAMKARTGSDDADPRNDD